MIKTIENLIKKSSGEKIDFGGEEYIFETNATVEEQEITDFEMKFKIDYFKFNSGELKKVSDYYKDQKLNYIILHHPHPL